MKKVFLIAAFAAVTMGATAQTRFGAQAGINMATLSTEGASTGSKSKIGLTIGALADVPFGGSISFRPELNFIQKGSKFSILGYESTTALNYVELSPNFVYNINAGAGKVFLGLGPSFGFGISGKMKEKEPGEAEVEGDIEFGSEDNEVKAFDYGLNLLGGYELSNGLFFSAGYNLGLANLSNVEGSEVKNRGFQIKIGFMFGGSKAAE
jgi:hypothetical protein